MNTKELKKYKESLKLTQFQRDIIVGLTLGDGHLETSNGVSYRMKIEHSIKQKEYANWLYNCFDSWVLSGPAVKEKNVFGKTYQNIWFNTISHVKLRYYGKMFYKDGKKMIPNNISKLLSDLSLAVWFMDDGSIKSKHHKSLIINTQCFPIQQIEFLQQAIEKKFQIVSFIRKQKEGFQIEFRGQNATKLAQIIEPYLVASMKYKIDPIGLTKLPKL